MMLLLLGAGGFVQGRCALCSHAFFGARITARAQLLPEVEPPEHCRSLAVLFWARC
jgi:transposase